MYLEYIRSGKYKIGVISEIERQKVDTAVQTKTRQKIFITCRIM